MRLKFPRRGASIDALERRVLLSQIVWENRGDDNFDAMYGAANAVTARQAVDRAIQEWQRVIVNFNYAGGGNRFNLDIRAAPLTGRGLTREITFDAQRKPTSADIVMDDDGAGPGWYFDPNIGSDVIPDDGEFTQINGPFSANIPGTVVFRSDFFRSVLHEIGHAVGITVGDGLKINDFLADSGVDDPNDSGTATIRWIDFGFGEFGTMTEAGGGHLYEGPAMPGQAVNVVHPDDLLNDGRTVGVNNNRRQLINDTHAQILQHAYGYTVAMPSKLNTFYVNLDKTSRVVTINVPPGATSTVKVEHLGAWMNYDVNLYHEQIFPHHADVVRIVTGNGDDSIYVPRLAAQHRVEIDAGAGNDFVYVGVGDIDSQVLSNLTINGGGGAGDRLSLHDPFDDNFSSDHYNFNARAGDPSGGVFGKDSWASTCTYTGFEAMQLYAADQGGNINVNFVPTILTAEMFAGDNANKFRIAAASGNYETSIRGNLILHGEAGNDNVEIHDENGGGGAYTLTDTYFRKGNAGTTSFDTCESLVLAPSNGPMIVNFLGSASFMAYYVDGGAGNDAFNFGNGTMNALRGAVHVNGAGGADSVTFSDVANTVPATYQFSGTTLSRSLGDGADGVHFQGVEGIALRTGTGADEIQLSGTAPGTPVSVFANGGTDTIRVYDTSPTGPVTVEPSTGDDSVNINGSSTVVRFAATQRIGALSVFGGVARLAADAGSMVLTARSLNVDDGGRLDLTDEDMVIDYTGASPIATVQQRLAGGYAGGAWNGQGIMSSTAAAAGNTAVGYAESAEIFTSFPANFGGVSVDSSAVLLKYTLYGDANLSGSVNLQDFNKLAANFGQGARRWSHGDFDYSNGVNLQDFNKLAANFGRTGLAPDARESLYRQLKDPQDRRIDPKAD